MDIIASPLKLTEKNVIQLSKTITKILGVARKRTRERETERKRVVLGVCIVYVCVSTSRVQLRATCNSFKTFRSNSGRKRIRGKRILCF